MSDEAQRQYMNPVPPTAGTVPGIGITRLASSVTAAKEDMGSYPDLFGKRLTLKNESTTAGDALYVSFSSDGVPAIDAAASAGANIAAGTTTAQGFKLLPGESMTVRLDIVKQRWIHWDALANTPVLCIYPSSQPSSSQRGLAP
jgi:hypothetical protein